MRRAVVDEDGIGGQGESSGHDLDEKNASQSEPDQGPACLSGRRRSARDHGEVRCETVRQWEAEQKVAITL